MDTGEDDGAWLRRYHDAPEGAPRLLWFPHAGGSASSYFPFSADLSPSFDVTVVQYPGRADRRREPPVEELVTLAERIVGPARTLQRDGRPLAIFGHSMGATVAFEVARRLDSPPVAFFASGRRAPSRVRDERVREWSDERFVEEMRRLGGIDTAMLDNPRMLRMILPTIRGDYIAISEYRWSPGPPLACPVTALTGDADPLTTVDEARDWERHTSAAFGMRVFSGGHFFVHDHRAEIVDIVRDRLTSAVHTGNPR